MWIRERMLAAKNMNATRRNIFWDRINLKHQSDVRWLFNEVKNKPSVFLNILRGTVLQLTENNESENVVLPWLIYWSWSSTHGSVSVSMNI